jgi:hypothetical protein
MPGRGRNDLEEVGDMAAIRRDRIADGKPASLKRLLIATSALPAATIALMMAFTPEANATVYDYVISPGATLAFVDGNTEDLSGTFAVNVTGGIATLTAVSLTLTGPTPEAGDYTVPVFAGMPPPLITASTSGLVKQLDVVFSPSTLFFSSTMQLFSAAFYPDIADYPSIPNVTGTATGSADPAQSVPEPSTIGLLGVGLGLLGLMRHPTQRDHSPPSGQSRTT